MGRGRNHSHEKVKRDEGELSAPRMSLDYFSLSEVDKKASDNPMVHLVDEGTGENVLKQLIKKE